MNLNFFFFFFPFFLFLISFKWGVKFWYIKFLLKELLDNSDNVVFKIHSTFYRKWKCCLFADFSSKNSYKHNKTEYHRPPPPLSSSLKFFFFVKLPSWWWTNFVKSNKFCNIYFFQLHLLIQSANLFFSLPITLFWMFFSNVKLLQQLNL